MNEQQAIDYATENGIKVTTDKTTKHSVSFKVGALTVFRTPNRRLWSVDGAHDLYTRGEAIRVAVGIELEKREELRVSK